MAGMTGVRVKSSQYCRAPPYIGYLADWTSDMWAGAYTLDLYCENADGAEPDPDNWMNDVHGHTYNEFPHQYTDELGSICRARARRAGWTIKNDGTAICPKCSGKNRKPK